RGPGSQEPHHLRLYCSQTVQVQAQQFHCLVWPRKGAIDPRPAGADLLAVVVDLIDDQQFDVAPVGLVATPLLLVAALAFLLASDAPQSALACAYSTS